MACFLSINPPVTRQQRIITYMISILRDPMNILLLNSDDSLAGKSFTRWVASVAAEGTLHLCDSLDALERRLRRPLARPAIAVLNVTSIGELNRLVSIRHLLDDVSIILISPDSTPQSIQSGRKLYPRFMTSGRIDRENLGAIMRKMFAKHRTSTPSRPGAASDVPEVSLGKRTATGGTATAPSP